MSLCDLRYSCHRTGFTQPICFRQIRKLNEKRDGDFCEKNFCEWIRTKAYFSDFLAWCPCTDDESPFFQLCVYHRENTRFFPFHAHSKNPGNLQENKLLCQWNMELAQRYEISRVAQHPSCSPEYTLMAACGIHEGSLGQTRTLSLAFIPFAWADYF